MRSIPFVRIWILLILALAAPPNESLGFIGTGYPAKVPYAWAHYTTIRGASANLAMRLADALGVELKMDYMGPWPRVLKCMKEGKADLLSVCYHSEERESYMAFTVPYHLDEVVVFAKEDLQFPFKHPLNLGGLRGAVVRGEVYGPRFESYRSQLSLHEMDDIESCFRVLAKRNIDYVVCSRIQGELELRKQKLTKGIKAIDPPLDVLKVHMAVSRSSPLVGRLPEINLLLEELRPTFPDLLKEAMSDYLRTGGGSWDEQYPSAFLPGLHVTSR